MRAEDGAFIEEPIDASIGRPAALPKGPLGARIILRLHGAKPAHRING